MKSRRFSLLGFAVLMLVTVLILARVPDRTASGAASPESLLQQAWTRARQAGNYSFTTDIVQTSTPLLTASNVGRAAQQDQYHLEGTASPSAGGLTLTLWSQGGSVLDASSGASVKIEGDKAYARQGTGDWQSINNFTGLFAPDGDLLAFLAAAKNIRAAADTYTFELDGYAFAGYLRDQLEERLSASGELPPGVNLGLPEVYQQMTGHGEVRLMPNGYPRRLQLFIDFPPQSDTQLSAQITSDFAGFAPGEVLSGASTDASADFFTPIVRALPNTLPVVLSVSITFVAIFLAWHFRRSRKFQAALSLALIFSIVVSPALQSAQAANFADKQHAAAQDAQARTAESDLEHTLKQMEASQQKRVDAPAALKLMATDTGEDTDGDGLTNNQELILGTSPLFRSSTGLGVSDLRAAQALGGVKLNQLQADSGADADGDGLTDYQENLLGTSSSTLDEDKDGVKDGVDSDKDGVTDYEEVTGFDYNGQHYYTDPLEADTNKDGLPDGLEWKRPGTTHDTWDLDSDGEPDLVDRDNDGDGVPDNLDLSPFVNPGKTFSNATPLTLRLDNVAPNTVAYVSLQFRPTISDQLRYAYNVLDWPRDTQGQMQDIDGKTFYDLDPSLPANPNANGDVKLVPMLEVRTSGATSNLPLRAAPPTNTLTLQDQVVVEGSIGGQVALSLAGSDTRLQFSGLGAGTFTYHIYSGSCANLGSSIATVTPDGAGRVLIAAPSFDTLTDGQHAVVVQRGAALSDGFACANLPKLPKEGAQWIDTELLNHYGISVLPQTGGGFLLYAPVQLTTIEKTGEKVAFFAKLIYRPQAAGWGSAQEVRLVWLVQALVDHCRNGNLAECTLLNNPEVLQTYTTDFTLTGVSVREDRGFDTAVIYEDPAVDTDLNRDDAVLFMAHGLEQTFLAGVDCDTVVNDQCAGDGSPDFTLAEIQRRFDHTINAGVSITDRWELSNTLSVKTFSYAHADLALTDMTSVQNPAILDSAFSAYAGSGDLYPTLMTLSVQRYRSVNLDAALNPAAPQVTWTANDLILNLNGQSLTTQAGVTWTPYRYAGGVWRALPLAEYWDIMGPRYAPDFSDETDPELAAGKLNFVRLYYLTIAQGASRAIQVDNVIVPVTYRNPKVPAVVKILKVGAIGKFLVNTMYFIAVRDLVEPALTLKYLGKIGEKIFTSVPLGSQVLDLFRCKSTVLAKIGRGAVITGLVVLAVFVIGALLTYIIAGQLKSPAAKIITKIGDTVFTAISVFFSAIKPLISMKFWNPTAFFNNLGSLSEAIGSSFYAAVIGLIIQLGIIWGTFIYAVASGQIQAGAVAFNQFLANAIAQTILAVLFFALALTVAGALLVGIISAIDGILSLLCNSFGVGSACFTLSGYAAQAISGNFYGLATTINFDLSELGMVRHTDLALEDPAAGFVDGSRVYVKATFYTRLVQDLTGSPPDRARIVYHAADFFNPQQLQQATVKYGVNISPTDATAGEMASAWTITRSATLTAYVPRVLGLGQEAISFDVYQGESEFTANSAAITLRTGLNQPVQGDLYIAYALPAAECWGVRGVSSCEARSVDGRVAEPIRTDLMVLDVFPATLDEFYTFVHGADFRQQDYDGDGLIAQAYGGLDPDDTNWDIDGDGVSDGVEVAQRTQGVGMFFDNPATGLDTDSDGLPDAEELLRGTNPAAADTDRDGLTDKQEIDGWLWAYSADGSLKTLVTSDPLNPDTDGDGNNDKLEHDLYRLDPVTYPFHPRRPDPVYTTISTFISDEDGYVGGGQTFTYTVVVGNSTPVTHPLNMAGTVVNSLQNQPFGLQQVSLSPLAAEFGSVASGQTAVLNAHVSVLNSAPNRTMSIASTATANFFEPSAGIGLNWVNVGDVQWSPDWSFAPRYAAIAAPVGWDDPYQVSALTGFPDNGQLTSFVYLYRVGSAVTALGWPDYTTPKLDTPPAAVCADNGRCLVVWCQKIDQDSPSFALIGHLMTTNGLGYGGDFTIADDAACNEGRPAAASDGHDFLVAWQCGGAVYARTVDNQQAYTVTTPLASIDLSAPNPTAIDARPAVAWTGNRYTLAWDKEAAANNRDLYAVQLNAAGGVLAAATPLATTAEDTVAPRVAYIPGSANAVVVYRAGKAIRGALLQGVQGGLSSAPTFPIAGGDSDVAVYNPVVAYDPRLSAWQVVWLAQTSTATVARFQVIAANSDLYGPASAFSYNTLSINPEISLACTALDCGLLAYSNSAQSPAERNYYLHRYSLRNTYPFLGAATASGSVTFTVETDNPRINSVSGFPASRFMKAGQTIIIGGTASDPTSGVARVEMSLDGAPAAVAQGQDTWLYSLPVPAAEGLHELIITAYDLADNGGFWSSTNQLFLADATPPTITSHLADNVLLRLASDAAGRFTLPLSGTVSDPRVAGFAANNTNLQVEVNVEPQGRGWQPANVNGTTWSLDYPLSTLEADGNVTYDPTGVYTVSVRATDEPGNRTAPIDYLTIHVQADNTAPQASLITPDPGQIVQAGDVISITSGVTLITQTLTLTGTVAEARPAESGVMGQSVRLRPIDAAMWPGLWSAAYRNSADPAPAFTRADADTNGGLSFDWGLDAPDARLDADNFTVDWQRLTAFSVAGTYTFTLIKDAASTAQIRLDNGPALAAADGSITTTAAVVIGAGLHQLEVSYTDLGGAANVRFEAALAQPDWAAATLAAAGTGVQTTTWQYPLPANTEGLFNVELRGADRLGNTAADPQSAWQGEIDLAAPRLQLAVDYTGVGATARTTYRVWATDFNLSETGWASPCPIELGDRYNYTSAWWQQFAPDQTRLYQIYSECAVAGHVAAPPVVEACDIYDHCATSTSQKLFVLPNQRNLYVVEGDGQVVRLDLNNGLTATLLSSGADNALTVGPDNGLLYYPDTQHRLSLLNQVVGGSYPVYTDTLPVADVVIGQSGWIHWTAPAAGLRSVTSGGAGYTEQAAADLYGLDFDAGSNRIYAAGTSGGLGQIVIFYQSNPAWRITLNSTDPTHSNGWAGQAIAVDKAHAQMYLAGQCGDPAGGAAGAARSVIQGIHRLPLPGIVNGTLNGVTGCTPVIRLSDPADVILNVEIDDDSNKLYYLLRNTSTGVDGVWRANLDGSALELIYTSGQALHAFAIDDTNRLPFTVPTSDWTLSNQAVNVRMYAADYNGDALAYTVISPPQHGTLPNFPVGPAPQAAWTTYVPEVAFDGLDSFTYQADDGRGGKVIGVVQIQVSSVFKDSTILTPTQNSLAPLGPITITTALRAYNGIRRVALKANGLTIYSCQSEDSDFPSPYTITETEYACVWTPAVPGRYDLTSIAHDGWGDETDLYTVTVYVTHDAPTITIEPTVLTTTHRTTWNQYNVIPFQGIATDTTGGHTVEVQINDDGLWRKNPVVSGTQWTYELSTADAPDNITYTVAAKATDRLNQTTLTTTLVRVDIAPPAPVTVTLSAAGVGVIAAYQTVRTTHDLSLAWPASTDGSGVAGYFAGWTTSATPPTDGQGLTWYTASGQHTQTVADGRAYYAHLGSVDTLGNVRWQTAGPVYVDAPVTPDLINLAGYTGWLDSAGAQVGVDYALYRRSPAYNSIQRFYTTWDADGLALAWTGSDWWQSYTGNLFIYLDTASGGTTHAYDPFGGGPDITLPAQDGRQLAADYVIHLVNADTIWLYHWNGSAWQLVGRANGSIDYPAFTSEIDQRNLRTIIKVPFAALGITDPAATSLDMVAFASEPTALKLWATMPDQNPVNSLWVANNLARGQTITAITLTQQYHWDALAADAQPNLGQFADQDLSVWLTAEPGGQTVSYLDSDLYNLLTPGVPLDANRDGVADRPLPIIAPPDINNGQIVTYTVHYQNPGAQTATGVNLRLSYGGALTGSLATLSLGSIAAGASGAATFTATVNSALDAHSAELDAVIADDVHGDFDWSWTLHRVHSTAPTNTTIDSVSTSAYGGYIRSGAHTASGTAVDLLGVDRIELEVTHPDASIASFTCPQPDSTLATWQCTWSVEVPYGVISLRARARNTAGFWGDWSAAKTVTVDNGFEPFGLTLDPALLNEFQTGTITGNPIDFHGTTIGPVQSAEVCIETSPVRSCQFSWVTPAVPTPTWSSPIVLQADGAVFSYTLTAYDPEWRSIDQTGTLRVDNVEPAVTTSCPVNAVNLLDYWVGNPALTPAPLMSGTASDGGGPVSAIGSVIDGNGTVVATSSLAVESGAWSFTPRFATAGYQRLSIDFTDTAGNTLNRWCWANVLPPNPDVSLRVTTSPVVLYNTGPVTYVVTISNSVIFTATGVNFGMYDGLVESLTLTSPGAVCTFDTWNCALGALAPDETRTFTLTGSLRVRGDYTHTVDAWVNSTEWDADYNNNYAASDFILQPRADLQISQRGPTTVSSGETFSYTLFITNTGPSAIDWAEDEDPRVYDSLPSGLDFVGAGGDGWTCQYRSGWYPGGLRCIRSGLAVGAAPPIVITVTRPLLVYFSPLTLTHTVQIGNYYNYVPDPDLSNNTSALPLVVEDRADLAVQISSLAAELNLGQSLTYFITATNAGPNLVVNATLLATLPSGLAVTDHSPGLGEYFQEVGGYLDNFAPGETRAFTVTALATGYNAWVTTTVTLGSAYYTELNAADNIATALTWLKPTVDLWGAATVTPDPVFVGEVLTYTAVITNDGPGAATFITVTDALPAAVAYQSAFGDGWTCANIGNNVTCTRPTLGAGQAATLTVTAVAIGAQPYLNNYFEVHSPDLDRWLGNNTFGAFSSSLLIQYADLNLSQAVSADPIGIGGSLDYTLTVSNLGTLTAENIVISDTLPAGVAYNSASGSDWNCTESSGVITCSYLYGINPSGSTSVVLHTTLSSGSGLITNTAAVSTSTAEHVMSNNTARLSRTVNLPADVAVTLSADAAYLGLNFNVYLNVANHGPETADSSLIVTATWSGVEAWLNSAGGADWSCGGGGPLVCTRTAPLAAGATSTITLNMRVNDAGTLDTHAEVSSRWLDEQPANNTADLSIPLRSSVDLALEKFAEVNGRVSCDRECPPLRVNPGGWLTYTITARDYSDYDTPEVIITDTLPAGAAFAGFVSTADWASCGQSGGVITCTRPGLASYFATEAAAHLIFRATAPSTPGAFTNEVVGTTTVVDAEPESNIASAEATVQVNVDTYADPAQVCGGNAPCFSRLQDAIDAVASDGYVTIYPGTYTEALTLNRYVTVRFIGAATFNGALDISDGEFYAPSSALTLTGDFTYTGGTFDANGGTLIFGSTLTQSLAANTWLGLNNLTVLTGTTLIETVPGKLSYVNASLINYGVIRKIMPVTGPGPITFGLAGNDSSGEWLTVEVADPGTFTSIQIDRIDRDHPQASHMNGRYWTITPAGSGVVTLTLPHSLADPAHARVCRYETSWDCRADSYTANTVTRGNIASFSDWAVRDYTGQTTLLAVPGGQTSGWCDSWATACELRYALTSAASGQEIWAAAGTYTPTTGTDRTATFQLQDGVALYGGFAATETLRTERNPATHVTILSGDIGTVGNATDNSYHVVSGTTGATLDGFTITAGNANGGASPNDSGGGMLNTSGSSPTLTNITFSGNSANAGGGLYNTFGSNPALTNVTFSGNSAIHGGGLFNFSSSSPTLTNVTFSDNSASGNGGGLYNYASNPALTNVTFSANSAGSYGGGMLNYAASSPTLTNATFGGNWAGVGGGLYNWEGSSPQVRNTIFWGNAGAQIYNADIGSAPVVSDSVVQDGYAGGTNIITADPLLGALGNYGGRTPTLPLLPGSSAIDAGNPATCAAADQRGQARDDLQCDLGAYELKFGDSSGIMRPVNSTALTTFGPALVGLRRDASGSFTDPGVITVTKSTTWKTRPANSIAAYWYITPTVSSGFSLTLQLCYTSTESNGLSFDALRFWRFSASGWNSVGGLPVISTVGTNTCAAISGVTELSSWTLAPEVPTAVTLITLQANSPASVLPLTAMGLAMLVGVGVVMKRRRNERA